MLERTEELNSNYGETNIDMILERVPDYVSKRNHGIITLERDISVPRDIKESQRYYVRLSERFNMFINDEERKGIMNNEGVLHTDKVFSGYLEALLISLSEFEDTFKGPDKINVRILPGSFYRVKTKIYV